MSPRRNKYQAMIKSPMRNLLGCPQLKDCMHCIITIVGARRASTKPQRQSTEGHLAFTLGAMEANRGSCGNHLSSLLLGICRLRPHAGRTNPHKTFGCTRDVSVAPCMQRVRDRHIMPCETRARRMLAGAMTKSLCIYSMTVT